jgi:hypothetical protein
MAFYHMERRLVWTVWLVLMSGRKAQQGKAKFIASIALQANWFDLVFFMNAVLLAAEALLWRSRLRIWFEFGSPGLGVLLSSSYEVWTYQ